MPTESDEIGAKADEWSERRLLMYVIAAIAALAAASHYPRLFEQQVGADSALTSRLLASSENSDQSRLGEQPSVPVTQTSDDNRGPFASETLDRGEGDERPATAEKELAIGSDDEITEDRNDLGLLDSDFRLSGSEAQPARGESDSSEPIRVRKTVAMGNSTIGSLPITIDSESQLSLEISDLRQLLSGQAGFTSRLQNIPESGAVSFQRLRDMGIDLRYNPTSDQVTLQRL